MARRWRRVPRARRRAGPTARDYAWAALAALFALVFVGNVVNAVWRVVGSGEWWGLVGLPVGAIVFWWLGAGSWRRTRWGRPPYGRARTR